PWSSAQAWRTLLAQTPAQRIGVDVEDIADALEGEDHGAVFRLQPCTRLIEQAPCFRIARVAIPAIAVDGVPEHRQHEAALALERLAPGERRTEAVDDEDVGFEHFGILALRRRGRSRCVSPLSAARRWKAERTRSAATTRGWVPGPL